MAEKPDSLTCGACCVSLENDQAFCNVDEEDQKRLDRRFLAKHLRTVYFPMEGTAEEALAVKDIKAKTGPLKGIHMNVCVALRGSPMSRVSCSIYSKCPKVCDSIKAGDKTCLRICRLFQAAADAEQRKRSDARGRQSD